MGIEVDQHGGQPAAHGHAGHHDAGFWSGRESHRVRVGEPLHRQLRAEPERAADLAGTRVRDHAQGRPTRADGKGARLSRGVAQDRESDAVQTHSPAAGRGRIHAAGLPRGGLPRVENMDSTYDAIIIGTGQAGPSMAARLSSGGMKVAVIERGKFGGTCVNNGCIPTKTLVSSAYAAHSARRSEEYGVGIGGPVKV